MIAHWLPCYIDADQTSADIESMFISREQCSDIDGSPALMASIRGRPVRGKKLDIPKPYVAVLVQPNGHLVDGEPEPISITQQLESVVLWNLSEAPQVSDKIPSAFLWLHVSDTIHSP
ncbi:unnamed protein product [Echinostoma caproni]|uniref:Uncharacterized protein n=1 Tax=Echinostoma caproni TaxID=27848 RepID=A0A183B3M8_9TREM|nr:unnamed protein product [Echinostoma caproni]